MGQRREWKQSIPAGTTANRVLNYVRSPLLDYTLVYQSSGVGQITIEERGESDVRRTVVISVGQGSAGRVRVQGACEVSFAAETDSEFQVSVLHDAPIEPVPPVDSEHDITNTGWTDIGPNGGWCPPERYTCEVYSQAEANLRFVNRSGATIGQWTITGDSRILLHPPRAKLQAQSGVVGTYKITTVYR